MPNKKPARSVIVAGDVTMDWNIATSSGQKGPNQTWSQDANSAIFLGRGGAAQLADLVEAASLSLPVDRQYIVHQANLPSEEVSPSDKRYHHSFKMWSPFKYSEKTPQEKPAWRVEQFLGLDRSTLGGGQSTTAINEDLTAQLVVLDDDTLGYRNQEDLWPKLLQSKNKPDWILLKMAQPVARGPLWERLVDEFPERLVVVTTVNDLRQTVSPDQPEYLLGTNRPGCVLGINLQSACKQSFPMRTRDRVLLSRRGDPPFMEGWQGKCNLVL